MSDKIKALEARVEELKEQLGEANAALHAARLEATGMMVGDIVKSNRDGKLYRVTAIDVSWARKKPWLMGSPQRKDGSFGTAERHLFDNWEKPPA